MRSLRFIRFTHFGRDDVSGIISLQSTLTWIILFYMQLLIKLWLVSLRLHYNQDDMLEYFSSKYLTWVFLFYMKFLNNYQLWCLFTTHVKLLIKAISIIRHFDCSVSETEKSHTFAWFQAKVNVSQIHQPRKPHYNGALWNLQYDYPVRPTFVYK